jgi:hypothetical protein
MICSDNREISNLFQPVELSLDEQLVVQPYFELPKRPRKTIIISLSDLKFQEFHYEPLLLGQLSSQC